MAFVSIKIDTSAYGAALLAFRQYSKLTFREDIKMEARLLGQMLIKLTPPKSQAQGRAAVARDIGYIADGIEDEFYRFVSRTHGIANVRFTNYSKDRSASTFIDWQEMTEDFSRLKQFHRSQRNRRGRVNQGRRIQVTKERWDVKNALVVPKSLKKRYVTYEQGFVGAAKGGWARGTLHVGGKAPAWVSRRANSTFGGFIDSLTSDRPGFTFINRSPWAGSGDEALRITRDAVRIRTENLEFRTRFAEGQKRAAARAGFRVVGGVASAIRDAIAA